MQCGPWSALYVNSNSSNRALYVGGNYNANDNYGFFYFNGNNNASNTNANLGSRHLVKMSSQYTDKSMPLGRNIAVRTELSRFVLEKLRGKQGDMTMPKRVGYLYQRMCDKDRIREAIREGSRGKKKRWDVVDVMKDVEGYVEKVYHLLVTRSFVPTKPQLKTIFDSTCQKERVIMIVPFYPDGIMHQLCVMVMEPILMRGMYRWSCASIPKRGNKCAADYVKRALHNDIKGTKYTSKLDIRHFYPSIPVKRLIRALARKIKDKVFLKFVYEIISSNPDGGLAIGYYINQWLANFYLEGLDHFICTLPGVKYYVRNMDDMVLMGPNKKKLRKAVLAIRDYLCTVLRLTLKPNWQIFPTDSRGIDFVGFRFYHTHTAMRRRNFLRFARQCRKVKKALALGKPISYHAAAGLLARVGQLKHCDSHKIRVKYFDDIGVKVLKAVVRKHSRELLNAA